MKESDKLVKGSLRAPHRSLLYALGLESDDFNKPFIGIVNSFNETVPGHTHLRQVVEHIKEGIYKNGGIPFEFNTIAICDGLAMNHEGMSYSLASRQLICDSVVVQAKGFAFDGLVFVPNCDKVVPGMMMAAAKLNLPSIFMSGGPMLAGKLDDEKLSLTSVFEAVGAYQNEELSAKVLEEIETSACPTCGSCSGMYTANTMNCLSEALGIALPGNGSVPAIMSKRIRMYKKSGKVILYLVKNNTKFLDIVTKKSMENAIVCDLAMAGSTNTILHLLGLAKYANIDLSLEDFERLSNKTYQLTKLSPASNIPIEDFDSAGGMYSLMNELNKENLIHDTKTILSSSLLESIKDHEINNYEIIHPINNPVSKTSGLSILRGNLAEHGAVIKTGAISKSQMYFKGYAQVFENEQSCVNYLQQNNFNNKDNIVIVIRNMGIKGGYGMPEMLSPTSLIKGMNIGDKVALITDGRFSGGSNGLVIGHISPEASENGLINFIENNDLIEIDIAQRSLNLVISQNDLESRMTCNKKKIKQNNDYLDIYTRLAINSSEGGCIEE
ncbi:MAG: dihydroxy-acid dehydratase [Erysipelotrichales bacterium]